MSAAEYMGGPNDGQLHHVDDPAPGTMEPPTKDVEDVPAGLYNRCGSWHRVNRLGRIDRSGLLYLWAGTTG